MSERLVFPGWDAGGIDIPTVCPEKSMTRQSDLEGSDINVIMRRVQQTGVLPPETREAVFTDVSEIGSYRDALEVMQKAQEGFYALPPAIREKFRNDAVSFLDFASRPENMAELQAMGVLEAPQAEVAPKALEEPAKPAGAQ